jgi:putative ABC transport system permease protein
MLSNLVTRLRSLLRRDTVERELDSELRFHFDQQVAKLEESGLTREEALRQTRLAFGTIDSVKEEHRDARGTRLLETLAQDVRYALRVLAKSPGFTAVAILTLALGIGANTAIFSVLDGVLLSSLPYPDPSRIVLVWGVETNPDTATRDARSQVSATDVMDWRKQNTVFEEISTYGNWAPTLTGQGAARRVSAMLVGDGFFKILGAQTVLGRTFTPEENIDGNDKVVVLSFGMWQRDFGGDPGVVGRSITLGAVPHTIVGVLSPRFQSLPVSLLTAPAAEVYRPVGENYDVHARNSRHLRAIARLKPGVTIAQAQADMTLISARLTAEFPADETDYSAKVVPMKEDLVGGLRPALLALFGAATFVLLIACANVANLLLARSAARQREIALRCALGASRRRLLQQMLTESVLLSLLGGVAGIALALALTRWIAVLGEKVFPALNDTSINIPVLVFTFVAAVGSAIVFGAAPARQAARVDANLALKQDSRTIIGGNRFRHAFVVAEIALAMVLVVGAGLMVRSVVELYRLSPGFNADHVISADFSLPSTAYKDHEKRIAFLQALLAKANQIPGAESVALTSLLPLGGDFDGRIIIVQDKPRPEGQEFGVEYYAVSPNYFATMKIPLVAGRYFNEDDRLGHAPVAIIGEATAHTVWPGENPIGKQIRAPGLEDDVKLEPWATVVGVVSDVAQFGVDRSGKMQVYRSEWQVGFSYLTAVARAKVDPQSLAQPLRATVQSMDSNLAVWNVVTMEQLVADSLALRRLAMNLLASFALLALVLSCIGIYGVVSYSVVQRTSEIGIRAALGALPGDVLRLVLSRALALAGIGLAIGSVAALAATRLLSTLLFRVRPYDPLTFCAVALLLAAVAAAACVIPARRATRIDPMTALRHE